MLPYQENRRSFVHLAYLDDSDTKQKKKKWQVLSAVVIEDHQFPRLEVVLDFVREDLIPPEKIDEFEEFHACELYGGYGVFEGIDQDKRFDAIRLLLTNLKLTKASVIYGAVDLVAMQSNIYGSAEPLDVAFRTCIKGVRECVRDAMESSIGPAVAACEDADAKAKAYQAAMKAQFLERLAILIIDDFPDRKLKELLSRSFRGMRGKNFSHFHDDVYFGDSRYSIGIQMADLCSYFIARHLEGDEETEPFYEMIKPYLAFSETHPVESLQKSISLAALSGLMGNADEK